MDQQLRAMGMARVALGVAFLLVPRRLLRIWFGADVGGPVTRLMARSAGGRDVALGLGTLFAVKHGSSVRGWLEATMVVDATDAVALVVAARDLPKVRTLLPAVPAVAFIAYGRQLVSKLPAAGGADVVAMP